MTELVKCRNWIVGCDQLVRPQRPDDPLIYNFEWVHEHGNPLCDVELTAGPVEDNPEPKAELAGLDLPDVPQCRPQ